MAIVLDAFASYVNDLLTQAAKDEVGMLLGISGEIKKLEGNLENLKAFLADTERRRITDLSVQGWVRKLKDAMYDATDILELCQLKAEERRESMGGSSEDKPPGCCHPLLFCLRNPVFAHKMGSRIKTLNQKLDHIHKMAADFKFSIIGSYPHRMADIDADLPSRKTMSEMEQSAIVGEKIESDTRVLVQELTTNGDSSNSIKVVSIVGIGGIGKTTLAQKIFNDETINEHFKKKMWLSVTQNFDEADLLRTAISHAGGNHGGEQDKTLLVRALTDTLSVSKFLLVLDDMWSDKAWNDVLRVPIVNAGREQPESRVVVTTRMEDLARRMGVLFHQHHVSKLHDEDAWALLKKQLPQVVGNESDIDQLKDIGMGIIKKCDGLPLAVKVMGGLLSTRYPSEHEWKCVLNDPAWSVEMPKELNYPLYFSYEDLSPPQLKQCFLYYSLISKCFTFEREEVIRMWISEGLVQDDGSSQEVEEIGIKYYRELITRNLIEPDISKSSIGYACNMHDVVRSFAQFMAREESLVLQEEQITGSNNSLILRKFRRLSIEPTKSIPKWADLQQQESLRTLIISCKINFKPGDSLDSFSSLRVLNINFADSDRLVGSLCHLKHLRYLSLHETDISRLPEDMDKMKFLQYILLVGCTKLVRLPGCIVRLVHLRTLVLEGSNVSVVPKGFGGLTNLRKLICFPVHMDGDGGWCSMEELAPLSQLRDLSLEGLENVSASLFAEKAMIRNKEYLSYLELNCNSRSTMDPGVEQQQQIIEEVFNKLCSSPSCIENVFVEGYFGRRLPDWMWASAAAAFKSLRYLTLRNLTYCTQLPDGWCRLPNLEGLYIERAPAIKRVGPEFQSTFHQLASGEATVTSSFPKLRQLGLNGLSEWEEWEWSWEEQEQEDISKAAIAMPALEELKIVGCCKLSRLPPGLANSKRRALREVLLEGLTNLTSVENFPSVVKLDVFDCPKLKSISGLSRLQKIRIVRCPNVEVLEGVRALDSMVLEDSAMEKVPGYLLGVNPRYFELVCSKKLHDSLLQGSSSECGKIRHVRKVKIDYLADE